ncbi:FecR family protein [Pinibacter aurantiacus]|uniref:FecR domain-containing protein n=1 Tax=Pinibacter aurantiacus TaxID=2851599 RepID=A0A9E2SAA1_9BACT|nr:FecR domain-containing protein [Pinibacter aurantiacus]MBV4358841.1 FecR domain-containing protein [Pinibacter aurantiacus]
MSEKQFQELLERYKQQNVSIEEKEILFQAIARGEYEPATESAIWNELLVNTNTESWTTEREERILSKLLNETKAQAPAKLVPFYRRKFFRIAAAACILLFAGGIALHYYSGIDKRVTIAQTPVSISADVAAPQSYNARLTLADGSVVMLDSAGAGTVAVQGKTNVIKKEDGSILYNETSFSPDIAYNTLAAPRGGKVVTITLSDGTKVWLNSESTLRYPINFSSNVRKVELTGEGYFEVAKNPSKQFIVKTGDVETAVLGTRFNVNSYADEAGIRVSLLEGSVKVTNGSSTADSKILKPGQQVKVDQTTEMIANADMEQVLAWKNGYFQFNSAAITTVMREAARWYDIDVEYSSKASNDTFSGKIPRSVNLSRLLKWLEWSDVHFRLEKGTGKNGTNKLVILP